MVSKKAVPLHSSNGNNSYNSFPNDIGIWCNGNTTDSGPVIPGSNPGIPTNLKVAGLSNLFLIHKFTFHNCRSRCVRMCALCSPPFAGFGFPSCGGGTSHGLCTQMAGFRVFTLSIRCLIDRIHHTLAQFVLCAGF